jgi:hypothetical protein
MRAYLLVLVGGGIGSAMRHAVNVAFARWFGTSFPFHTLFENVPLPKIVSNDEPFCGVRFQGKAAGKRAGS